MKFEKITLIVLLQSSVSAFISPLERNEDPSNVLVPTLTAVPDSCCLRPERAEAGCGKKAFKDDDDNQAIRPQDARIRYEFLFNQPTDECRKEVTGIIFSIFCWICCLPNH